MRSVDVRGIDIIRCNSFFNLNNKTIPVQGHILIENDADTIPPEGFCVIVAFVQCFVLPRPGPVGGNVMYRCFLVYKIGAESLVEA